MMDISKALLEKYERGQCTDQERAAVQNWLESDSWDDFEEGEVKHDIKTEIWQGLINDIEPEKMFLLPTQDKRSKSNHWSIYAAAACLLFFIGFSFFYATNSEKVSEDFYAHNKQQSISWLHEQTFDVLLSENSSAHIDLKANSITLSGNIMFKPKRDLTLHDTRNNAVFHFKRDQTYLLSEYPSEHRFVVLQKDELAFLPPPIQRKLKKQFQIS